MKYEITAVHRFSNGSGEPPVSFMVKSKEVAEQIVKKLKKERFTQKDDEKSRRVRRYATVLVREVTE